MNGGVGLTGQSPCAAWMSVWHRPAVSTLTSTSPGPGTGLGTCSTLSGLVKSWTTAAFMGLSKLLCGSRCDGAGRPGTGRWRTADRPRAGLVELHGMSDLEGD